MCHHFKNHCSQSGNSARIVIFVLGGLSFIVTAIGWYTCAYTHYCPDPAYPYVYKTQNNPEVYVCAQNNDCFPGPSNPSIESPTHHCSNYYPWMWSFICSLVTLIICGFSYCECHCVRQEHEADQLRNTTETSVEIPTKISAEPPVETPVETPIETPETPIEIQVETPLESLLDSPRKSSTSHLRIEIPP